MSRNANQLWNVLISGLERLHKRVMFTVKNNSGSSGSTPVTEADLIAYLDGEVEPLRRAEIDQAMALSWETRNMLEQLRRDLEIYDSYSSLESGRAGPTVDQGFADLQSRLRHTPAQPPRAAGSGRSPALSIRVAACFLVAVAAGSYFLMRRSTPTKLAAEVALRSREAEAKAIASVPDGVVHQKLKARRISKQRSASADWDIWGNSKGAAVRESFAVGGAPSTQMPAVIGDVKAVLERARRNPARPLSSDASDGSNGSAPALPVLTADGESAYTLVSEVRDSVSQNLFTIAITIRERDWHPVAGKIAVGEQSEEIYELNEIQYEILPRFPIEELPPSVSSNRAAPVAPPAISGSTPVADTTAEIEVLFALHQLNTCLGSVSVRRNGTGLAVTGVVPDEARRQQILRALSGLAGRSHLEVVIQTAQIAMTRAFERKGAIPVDSTEPAATVIGTASPLESLLRKRSEFDSTEWSRIAPTSLAAADAALSEAAEIRRLVEVADRIQPGTSDSSRGALLTMLRDHLTRLGNGWRTLMSAAAPVLHSIASASGSSSGPPSSPAEVFLIVQRVDSDVHRMFAEPGPDAVDVPAQAAALSECLRQIDVFLASSRSAVEEWIPKVPPGRP